VWTPGTIDFIESSPSFSSAGDINGDGFGDLIVAYADEDQDFRTVRLFLGSADGLATTPAWSWTDDAFNVGGGISVAGLGDVNGDGFDDAAVAVPASTTPDGADGSSGQVIVLLGDGKGLDEGRSHIVRPTLDEGETFGAAIGAAGDVNGDGYADLIATSLSGDGQLRWYLFPGGEQGIRSVPLWIEDTFALDPEFAIFQTIAGGDVNGDGLADLVLSDVDINRIMGGDSTVGQALLLYGAGIPTDGPDGEDVTVDITGAGGITETEDIAGTEDVVTDEPISDSPSAADLEIAEEIEIDVDDTRFLTLSPDGTRLLAERPADRALCIYTAVPLAEEFCVPYRDSMRSVMTSNLSWSPDSRFIVFTEDYYLRLDESDVWRLDVETGQLENLTDDGSEGRSAIFTPEGDVPFDVLPVFAPDGAAILFERSMRSGEVWAGSSLYEMSEATGELTELVQLSEGEQLILLSLDYDAAGDIVYSVYIGGADARNGIWLLPAGETEPSLILTPDEERGPPQVVQVAAGKALLWYGEYAGRFRAPTLPIFEVLDLATGETVALELPNDTIEQSGSVNAILSPDATKVLYAYRSGEQTWRLAVRDLGGDVETVLLERDEVIGWSRARSSGLEWVAGDRIFVAGYTVDRVIELAPR
jgi:hypothetical protein